MDEKKIAYYNDPNIDAEKAEGNSSSITVPISYTYWDCFVERLLHPASALSLCLLSLGILLLGLHILWIAAWYADYSILVPLAFIYNKATPLPDGTNYNFNVKGLGIIMGTGGAGIIAGLGAVAFACLAYIVPREKLLGYVSISLLLFCSRENDLLLIASTASSSCIIHEAHARLYNDTDCIRSYLDVVPHILL